jgi:hypothetical protein
LQSILQIGPVGLTITLNARGIEDEPLAVINVFSEVGLHRPKPQHSILARKCAD